MGSIVMQFIMLLFLVGMINSIIGLFKIRKILKDNANNPNLEGIAIVNGEVKIIEKNKIEEKVLVLESIHTCDCGIKIAKDKAYRAFIGDEEHYFCSWDCREKFI